MTGTKDEATKDDTVGWTGKPADGVAVKATATPPLPVEAVAATGIETPPATAPAEAKPDAAKPVASVIAPNSGYAVFFFPAALEALGPTITPHLVTDNGEPHILCREVDTGGAFIEITVDAESADGTPQTVELMFPANMVRIIKSVHSDGGFGFSRPRSSMKY